MLVPVPGTRFRTIALFTDERSLSGSHLDVAMTSGAAPPQSRFAFSNCRDRAHPRQQILIVSRPASSATGHSKQRTELAGFRRRGVAHGSADPRSTQSFPGARNDIGRRRSRMWRNGRERGRPRARVAVMATTLWRPTGFRSRRPTSPDIKCL
jgi:hypothetical protein